jgi:flavodoxin
MHSLIVYDSQFGNTEHIAHLLAKMLDVYGPARAAHVNETAVTHLRDVDLLVFGCPNQPLNASSAIRLFIERLPPEVLRVPKVACFDTRSHLPPWLGRFAAPQLVKQLKKLGIEPLAAPEGFFLKEREGPLEAGEAERAAEWGKMLAERADGV